MMKTIFEGKDLHAALKELSHDVPKADSLIFSANGKLEITAFSSVSFQGKTVEMPCDSAIDGTVGIKSFDQLYRLSQDKDMKSATLTFATDGDDRLSLITTIRHEEPARGFNYRNSHIKHSTHKYSIDVPAEYRFDTLKFIPVNIAPVVADEEPEAPAPHPGPSPDLLKSVTVPSVMVKIHLPRTRDTSVTIASTSAGVIMIVGHTRMDASRSVHIIGAATEERFSVSIPVKVLRAAIKASDTLTIGIRGQAHQWQGLKSTNVHDNRHRRYDPDEQDALSEYRRERYEQERIKPRQSFRFVETTVGEVNGVPIRNKHTTSTWKNGNDRWERDPQTCTPYRQAIAYRDTMRLAGTTPVRIDNNAGDFVYGPWHYVRKLNVPTAIAEQIARRMSEQTGRLMETVSVGVYEELWQSIVIEPEVNPESQWKVLRVDRNQTEGSGRWKYKREGIWYVYATFEAGVAGKKTGTARIRIASDMNDADSKALTKRKDLAERLLNVETDQEAVEELLHREAAPKPEVRQTLFGDVTIRATPVRSEVIRHEPVRIKPVIQEPITLEMFA
jgi:hypothetical protein